MSPILQNVKTFKFYSVIGVVLPHIENYPQSLLETFNIQNGNNEIQTPYPELDIVELGVFIRKILI